MEKKNNGLLIAIIILLVLGLIGLGGYIVYDKMTNNKEVKEVKEETKVPVVKEEEISSISLKNDLKNKIDYIYNFYSFLTNYDLFKKEVNLDDISSDYKFGIVLNSLSSNGIKQDIKQDKYYNEIIKLHNISKEELDKYSLDSVNSSFNVILDSDVKDRYQELFGTTIENMLSEVKFCPQWVHSESTSTYIGRRTCGGNTTPIHVITYNNKYTVKGNEAYVYISSGTKKFGSLYTEYSEDLDSKTPYKKLDDNQTTNDYQKILEENYKDFSEYKATFKKNADGDYYFYSVKRIQK